MDIEDKELKSTATGQKAVVPTMARMERQEAELGCIVVEVQVDQVLSKSTVNKLEHKNELERTAGEIKMGEKVLSLSLKNDAKQDLEPTRKETEGRECGIEALNSKTNKVQCEQMELDSSVAEIEDEQTISEDGEGESSDSYTDYSDKETTTSEGGDRLNYEVPLTDHEVDELIAELLETESKAAEAQETLEKESLAHVENEVRLELAGNLQGDDLDMAVEEEMKTFVEQWEEVLDDLEAESALLLEQLDGAGVDLPGLFKWIEQQAPEGCSTEAWRKRIHWAGSQMTNEVREAISGAENYLQECRPVKRRHGKVLEEGASGFLAKKLKIDDGEEGTKDNLGKDWDCVNELLQPRGSTEGDLFGSAHWASVYLASTPQEAANMGLKLPGVNEVEEIDDIDGCSGNPFYDAAVAGEKETGFTDEQKINFRKIVEEDDLNISRKLQIHLKQRRHRNLRKRQQSVELNKLELEADSAYSFNSRGTGDLGATGELSGEGMKSCSTSADLGDSSSPIIFGNGLLKHSRENEEHKEDPMVIIDSDDDIDFKMENVSGHATSQSKMLTEPGLQGKELVEIVDDDSHLDYRKGTVVHMTVHTRIFRCTVCFEVLEASDVRRHPVLEVIICESCKKSFEVKLSQKDPDCSECSCGWCGRSNDLINCKTCKMLFCTICIRRNLGEDCLKPNGWVCCCCCRSMLEQLISDCKEALTTDSLVVSCSESGSELSNGDIDVSMSNKKRHKKRIRRIMDDAELGEETKKKIAIEKERQEHIRSLHIAGKSWSAFISDQSGSDAKISAEELTGDAANGYIVNVAREENEEPIRVPSSISTFLKPHQIAGIRFMWENCIQSVRKVKSGDKGLGCILAHTMGLGKTLQVIAFLYTAMRTVDLGLRTALVVTPVNVLHNWRQEFVKWKPSELKSLRVFMLEDVSRENWQRAKLLAKWRRKGGVLLIGYAAFRNLSLGKFVKDKNIAGEICEALQNGPDVLVCDEAHMIKNTRADITHALRQVKCQRRIALTGSPLQNNLMEYYCMVDFVREGFLGSSHEFRNRFQNPIENGQHTNSTLEDVKIMNQRSHILYEQLKGFVHRMDSSVVKKELPPKTVYVISVKLSPLQRKLYKKFLDVHGFTNGRASNEKANRRSCFFAGYQALAQIWNHPGLLQMTKEYKENQRREEAVENFLVDGSSSDDNLDRDIAGEKPKLKSEFPNRKTDTGFFDEDSDWWLDVLEDKICREADYSGKMVLLIDLLSMSSEAGDKTLVFSQSLLTLDLVELFLAKLPRRERQGKFWKQGKDWYRWKHRRFRKTKAC
ncbi:protein CHROMATIN REMODELING 20 isoform X2 [Nymphaea colorata]|uniref:protein CHROMATIN REMODELING 20 isoform X2 n=1 Tax=Nymphaea colorata TaxID=210225 RepID=UPI00129EB6A2|nr:protein CHROMATIN REMODELING 20 isoform X2 [Nymphaea colorata]